MAKKKSAPVDPQGETTQSQQSSAAWSITSVAMAFIGAAVAKQLLNVIWRLVTGKKPPRNPANPEVGTSEAVVWVIASGATIALARMLATRRAANYFTRSTGKLPPGMEQQA
ncbi:MAG TPA: DUF4235 domain-containing protein [Marmoricola sp.]|nr:DUF4235 domain-containing protein [Marmoricola sp.]